MRVPVCMRALVRVWAITDQLHTAPVPLLTSNVYGRGFYFLCEPPREVL